MCHCLCKEYKRESKNTYLLEKTNIETNILLVHPHSFIKVYSRLWMSSLCLKMLLKWISQYGAVITVVGMCNNILIILTEIPFSLEKKLKNFRTEISWKFKKNLFAVSLVPLFVDQVVSLVVLLVDLAACSLQLHVFRFKFTANLFL